MIIVVVLVRVVIAGILMITVIIIYAIMTLLFLGVFILLPSVPPTSFSCSFSLFMSGWLVNSQF